MADFRPPIRDMIFTLGAVGADRLAATGAFPDFDLATAEAVLEEAGNLAAGVLAPLNAAGDRNGARLENGVVRTTPGFADAYRQFAQGGWNSIAADPAFGGQGLPHVVGVAAQELWNAANMAFGLNPILTQGAIEALAAHGTPEQKSVYLPKLVSGAWTGTMNLTEPSAGSDVGALTTRATRAENGTYRIKGSKIFITWGEHDCAENIVHLVLARLAGAPPGTRGISLFLVPKFLPDANGAPGARNDLRCVGLEHKLGIHGSPTCTMAFGEAEGAIGTLVGAENRGMAAMFTMMNAARLNVGTQGVAIAERAYQLALGYAQERRQGKPFGLQHEVSEMVPIIRHPDVRRMLLTMKSGIEAARAICLANAVALDLARHHPEPAARAIAKAREKLLTPLSKAWSTDMACRATSLSVQIHGGMGFIEETGAAQHYRDVRILPIYEGTNGIQAIDLVTRKITGQGAAALDALFAEVEEVIAASSSPVHGGGPRSGGGGKGSASTLDIPASLTLISTRLTTALTAAREAAAWLQSRLAAGEPTDALAGATPFLDLMGTLTGGMFLARGALIAAERLAEPGADTAWLTERIATARFFAENDLPRLPGLVPAITAGAQTLYAAELR